MSDMKEGEIGVLVMNTNKVFSLTHVLNDDDELFNLVAEHLNKKGCMLVTIEGTTEVP